MLITPHATVGSAIAVIVPNPLLAIPLSIASHYLLDTVPHWQETLAPYEPNKWTFVRVPIDILLAVGVTYWATTIHPDASSVIWLSAAASNVPDLDSFLVFYKKAFTNKLIKSYWDWHCRIQNETSKFYGVITQIVVIAAGILLINSW